MTNSNNAQPATTDIIRSMVPYLLGGKSHITGNISLEKTDSGQQYAIYTPPGYSTSNDDYPVLYHLHGAGMFLSWMHKELYWIAAAQEDAVTLSQTKPMIIISPYDTSKFSMWADSVDGSNNMATTFHDDLMPYVESQYRIIGERSARFIQGFSMGGFGAATHAFKYQDRFAAVAIWDGAMHNWDTITATRPSIATNQFADSEQAFAQWSPWAMVEQANLSRTPIMITSGLMVDFANRYTDFLEEHGAQVIRYTEDCLHEMKCLAQKRGRTTFEFFDRVMSEQMHFIDQEVQLA